MFKRGYEEINELRKVLSKAETRIKFVRFSIALLNENPAAASSEKIPFYGSNLFLHGTTFHLLSARIPIEK